MDESVGDGGGGGAVVEELPPILECEVGGDDGRGALVAPVEDLIEQIRAAGIEGQIAQLVDEEQLGCGPGGETAVEAILGLSGDEIVDEICGGGEADAVAAEASELSDGVSEVGLADAAGADEDTIGFVRDEVEGEGALDEIAVNGLWVSKGRAGSARRRGCSTRRRSAGRARVVACSR